MTLSQIFTKTFIFAGALALGSTTTIVVPMAHAASGSYFKAELAKPVESTKKIMRGASLKCSDTSCRASKASTADKNMCISIAREFGLITAFSAGDRQFDAKQLEKCNGDKKAVANRQKAERLAAN